jgi:uncharacterized protein (DUF488 family)
MKTFTIGFTQKNASKFFSLIKNNNVSRVIDVRLNNVSQLSGFAKRDDLKYFLTELCGADYVHIGDLAPTKSMLDAYKTSAITWDSYADKFLNLMSQRRIETSINPSLLDGGCLLCSEDKPHHCHRRLVVEYLKQHWNTTDIEVIHLT